MKKIYTFGLAIAAVAALAACNKENINDNPSTGRKLTIKANTEEVADLDTKFSIVENGTAFNLNWEGTETLGLANSDNTTYKNDWVVESSSGTSATLTGTGISVSDPTNWILASNLFSSATGIIRADIPANQNYDGINLAHNSLLVARLDDADASALESDPIEFKTMNAFLKFSLVKGSAIEGSTTSYEKMYVQNITVEAISGEDIAGRFEISKTAADWADAYSGVVSGQTFSKVTLDCTAKNSEGEELTDEAKDFYVAIAFGEYASGLKVTINVLNEAGAAGTVEKTFGATSGVTIERNTMRALAELTVNPVDAEAPKTYTLIDNPSNVAAGTYYLAAKYGDKYYLWTGSLTTASNKDAITAEYTYNTTTKVLTGDGAAEVSLVATTGGYYVKLGDNYLRVTANANRRLALDSTTDVWSFGISVDADDNARGGLKMTEANYNTTLLSGDTSTNVLRNYKIATNGNFGVYLFKEN